MIKEMNYRYNNPSQGIAVDSKIAVAFASKERTATQLETFRMWASMSKDAKEIEPILQAVQVIGLEQQKQATR